MKKFVNFVVMAVVIVFSNAASADLIAHWSLDNDWSDSAGTFNLTNSGASITSGGKIGGAASFSGSSQYASVTFTANAMFNPSEDYTVMAWYKLNINDITGNNRYQVFESGANFTASYGLKDVSGVDCGQPFLNNTNGDYDHIDINPGTNQQWHHIAITFNHLTTDLVAYVDGVYAGTLDYTGTLKGSTEFYVGTFRNHNGRFWNGLIDDVAVFDNIVSVKDIEYYAQGNAVPEPATVGLLALGSLLFARRRK